MKKFLLVLVATCLAGLVYAQNGDDVAIDKKFTKKAEITAPSTNPEPKQDAPKDAATLADLAQLLVRQTGLIRYLPMPPTDMDCIAALLANGIQPLDGWDPGKIVTRGDLAVIIVRALGVEGEVKNPNDPRSWFEVLAANGVNITTIGDTLGSIGSRTDAQGPNTFTLSKNKVTSNDPLTYSEVMTLLQEVEFRDVPRSAVTPN